MRQSVCLAALQKMGFGPVVDLPKFEVSVSPRTDFIVDNMNAFEQRSAVQSNLDCQRVY